MDKHWGSITHLDYLDHQSLDNVVPREVLVNYERVVYRSMVVSYQTSNVHYVLPLEMYFRKISMVVLMILPLLVPVIIDGNDDEVMTIIVWVSQAMVVG